MGRGAQSLARVAVIVRAGAAPMWWPGVVAAAVGAFVPGLTGRRIGLLAGAALFLLTAAVVASVRMRRYGQLAGSATRAGRGDFLQDRDVTVRRWRRGHRWWLLGAFLVAVASAFVVPGAGGLVLAGAGAGLWLKAVRIGRREVRDDVLYWVRTDWVERGRPAGPQVEAYRTTGPMAGDAAPGGARRHRR
ncbi:hypothetical protein K373_04788 [Streptomyces sp. DvalAA-21]|nr:integral membrane protein [Streptomyces sp. SirexAA-E]PZX35565.1 hypothetical protein K373_04788 [Streptomyces sp. DvalAA-21]RAJ29907.1 hypothetical protein K351_04841 [Streptomyces sp. DpondAA-E10]RAJ44354.1 hypothetical protein K352_04581 [Streptomyces sp. DpondAA-A50]SCM14863.1 hypothetical protein SAMN04883147_113152 [Streptomyces sp. DpondAA-F4]